MELRDISKELKNNHKKQRYVIKEIKQFIDGGRGRNGRIVILFGLRRTGKTVLMEQVLNEYKDKVRCAFYELNYDSKMKDVDNIIIEEKEKGTKIIFIDEITRAEDFIENSAYLADVYAKSGINIIVAGTESLSFVFADRKGLHDRTIFVRTTHIPFAEHAEILGIDDIDDYIMYGGLMREGLSEKNVYDYESAKKYLDSAVAGNIAHSIKNDYSNNILKILTEKEISKIIEKIVEVYSGAFNKDVIEKKLYHASVNTPLALLSNKEYEKLFEQITMKKGEITDAFIKEINADIKSENKISKNMVDELIDYLKDMKLLSVINLVRFTYDNNEGWRRNTRNKNYYIVQPAIKYHHLQKAKEFIQKEPYYDILPERIKKEMQIKLDEKIKGDMTEQIIVFDVANDLPHSRYMVTKTEFSIEGNSKGEYDMLIYDKEDDVHWAFEIKHTKNPFYKQEKHLQNENFRNVTERWYGNQERVAILYRGQSFIANTGTIYFNITDFLRMVNRTKDIRKTFSTLIKNLKVKDILSSEIECPPFDRLDKKDFIGQLNKVLEIKTDKSNLAGDYVCFLQEGLDKNSTPEDVFRYEIFYLKDKIKDSKNSPRYLCEVLNEHSPIRTEQFFNTEKIDILRKLQPGNNIPK